MAVSYIYWTLNSPVYSFIEPTSNMRYESSSEKSRDMNRGFHYYTYIACVNFLYENNTLHVLIPDNYFFDQIT
jgi:hypothetical protein